VKKKFKNFIIEKRGNSHFYDVLIDGVFYCAVISEADARGVVWDLSGRGEYLTDEMMEVIP